MQGSSHQPGYLVLFIMHIVWHLAILDDFLPPGGFAMIHVDRMAYRQYLQFLEYISIYQVCSVYKKHSTKGNLT